MSNNNAATPNSESHADNPAHVAVSSGEGGFHNVVRVLRKRRISIIITVILTIGLAVLVSLLWTPIYEADVLLEVLPESSADAGSGMISGAVQSLLGGDQLRPEVQTQVQVLRDQSVALDVVKTLNLQDRAPFKYVPGRFRVNKRLLAERGLPLENAPFTRTRILGIFEKNLDIEPIPNTRLISVSVTNPDPQLATDIANSLIKSLIKNHLEVRYYSMLETSKWMNAQMDSLKVKVDQSEQTLSEFEKQTGLFGVGATVSSGGGNQAGISASTGAVHSPILDRFNVLNQEYTAAEAARIQKEAVYRLTQTKNPDVVIGLGNSSLGNAAGFTVGPQGDALALLQNLRGQQASLSVQLADLTTKYGAANPKVKETQNSIAQLKREMAAEVERISERAENDFKIAQATENQVKQQFDLQEAEAVKVNGNALKAQVLAAEAAANQALYEDLYARLQEATVSVGLNGTSINLLDPALPPAAPKWPNWKINLGLGLIMGAFFGISLAFARENLNDKIVTSIDAEALARVPVFASIPIFEQRSKASRMSSRLKQGEAPEEEKSTQGPWVQRDPHSAIAESYRTLRTSVLLSFPHGSIKVMMVTSGTAGEGKTTTCYNLAAALAQGKQRVILIDADMRKPRIHHLIGTTSTPGLSDYLAMNTAPEAVIRKHEGTPNLDFITAGTLPRTPAELLGSDGFTQLIEDLKGKYDLVVVDCPPVLMVTDALLVARCADLGLIVARSGSTRKRALVNAVETMRRQSPVHLAIILNAVDTASPDYYYSYGYYGGGYYGEDTSNR